MAVPAPATPPPQPKPAPPTPPPVAPPKPPSPPPTVPVTAAAPAPQKPPTAAPKHEGSGVWWKILILLAVLLALGVLGYSIWTGMTTTPSASVLPPTNVTSPTTSTPGTTSTTPVGTQTTSSTTATNATSTNYGFASEDTYPFGQPVQIFGNDNDLFRDATRALGVKVIQFTDSRCPTGQTCVWAGEQGIHLQVTDELTGQMQEVDLGTITAPSVNALGATFQLNEINDGKGGTSATITVK